VASKLLATNKIIKLERDKKMEKELKNIKKVQELELDTQVKEGYCWLLANFDAVKEAISNPRLKTIGDTRRAIFKEIGFAPSIILSSKHLFKDIDYYSDKIIENYS